MSNNIHREKKMFYVELQKGFFDNDNNIDLTTDLGAEGFGVYMYVIDRLIGNQSIELEVLTKKIKRDLRVDSSKLESVVRVSADLYVESGKVFSHFINEENARVLHFADYGKKGGQAKKWNSLKKAQKFDELKEYSLECFPSSDAAIKYNTQMAAEKANDFKEFSNIVAKF